MGNRILKESIKTSDEIDQLSWFEYACFSRLIVTVDDYGRYYARPMMLKNVLFPLREDISTEAIADAIQHFAELDLIQVYTVNGKEYLQLTTWARHQTIRNKKSKFPGPEEQEACTVDNNCIQLKSFECKCSRNPIRIQSETESEFISESKGAPRGGNAEEDDEKDYGDKKKECEELTGIDQDLQEVLDAWQDAGFQTDSVTLNQLAELFRKNGRNAMLNAIDRTAAANARNPLRYLTAILDPDHRPIKCTNRMPAANFQQREYQDNTADMDRLMAGS